MTAARSRARCSTRSTASTWRGWSKSAGCRSSRSTLAGERRAGADERGRRGALERVLTCRGRARACVVRALPCSAEQRRPPVEARREVLAQRAGVGVAGGDEPARLQAGAREHARGRPRPTRRVASASRPGYSAAAPPCQPRSGRASGAGRPRAPVLEAVLGDRVARVDAVEQPVRELGRAGGERVQLRRGDHEQRHAVDAEVVEPVADQRAALEASAGSTSWSATRERAIAGSAGERVRASRSSRGQRLEVGELGGERALPAVRGGEAGGGEPVGLGGAGALDRGEQVVGSPGAKVCDERAEHAARTARSRTRRPRRRWRRPRTRRARTSRARPASRRSGRRGRRAASASRSRSCGRHADAAGRGRAGARARRRLLGGAPAPISHSGHGSARARGRLEQLEDALLAAQPAGVEDVVAARARRRSG